MNRLTNLSVWMIMIQVLKYSRTLQPSRFHILEDHNKYMNVGGFGHQSEPFLGG